MKKISDLNYCELIVIQTRKEAKQIAKLIRKDGEKAYSERILKASSKYEYPFYLCTAGLDIFEYSKNHTVHPVSDFLKPSKIDDAFDELARFDVRLVSVEESIKNTQPRHSLLESMYRYMDADFTKDKEDRVKHYASILGKKYGVDSPFDFNSNMSVDDFMQALEHSVKFTTENLIVTGKKGTGKHSTDLRDLKPKSKSIHESGLLFDPAKELEVIPEKWCVKVNEEIMQMFDYVYPLGYHHSNIVSSNYWKDNIKEGYTEITFDDFKRLVLKETPFKENKWYIYTGGAIQFNVKDGKGYGINTYRDWISEANWLSNSYNGSDYRLATDKEIETALIDESKKRGFKEGVKCTCLQLGCEVTLKGHFEWNGDSLVYVDRNDIYVIYQDGDWAEIISEPKLEKNHWYKSNNHQHVLVYYSTDENDNYHFDIDGVFSERCAPPRYADSWRLASESEVESHFISEANRRGFKPNQNIITPNGNKRNTESGTFKYYPERNAFGCGRFSIFNDGKWAEIIDITKPVKSEKSILEEAESKGFKTGCYIDNTPLGLRFKGIHNDTSILDYDGQTLTMGAKKKIIYRNGVWAKCGRIEFN